MIIMDRERLRDLINNSRVEIVQTVDVQDLLVYMRQNNAISGYEEERLKARYKNDGPRSAADDFVSQMLKKSRHSILTFAKVVREIGYESLQELASSLESSVSDRQPGAAAGAASEDPRGQASGATGGDDNIPADHSALQSAACAQVQIINITANPNAYIQIGADNKIAGQQQGCEGDQYLDDQDENDQDENEEIHYTSTAGGTCTEGLMAADVMVQEPVVNNLNQEDNERVAEATSAERSDTLFQAMEQNVTQVAVTENVHSDDKKGRPDGSKMLKDLNSSGTQCKYATNTENEKNDHVTGNDRGLVEGLYQTSVKVKIHSTDSLVNETSVKKNASEIDPDITDPKQYVSEAKTAVSSTEIQAVQESCSGKMKDVASVAISSDNSAELYGPETELNMEFEFESSEPKQYLNICRPEVIYRNNGKKPVVREPEPKPGNSYANSSLSDSYDPSETSQKGSVSEGCEVKEGIKDSETHVKKETVTNPVMRCELAAENVPHADSPVVLEPVPEDSFEISGFSDSYGPSETSQKRSVGEACGVKEEIKDLETHVKKETVTNPLTRCEFAAENVPYADSQNIAANIHSDNKLNSIDITANINKDIPGDASHCQVDSPANAAVNAHMVPLELINDLNTDSSEDGGSQEASNTLQYTEHMQPPSSLLCEEGSDPKTKDDVPSKTLGFPNTAAAAVIGGFGAVAAVLIVWNKYK